MSGKRGKGGRFVSKIDYDPDRRGEYEVSPPGESSRTHEIPASTIDVPPAPLNSPVGLHVEGRGLPDSFFVNADWISPWVDLGWETPLFDREKYELYGYEIIKLFYDGSSTAASREVAARLPREALRWRGSFEQEYRWNSGGDIEGYRVDALFRDLNPDEPNRIVRVGSTAFAPMR